MDSKYKEEFDIYLQPTDFIDSDSPGIIKFAELIIEDKKTDIDKAVKLFYEVRDSIIYDPYQFDVSLYGLKASTVLKRKAAYCVPKAILLAAAARVAGIPSRLGFADVKNHLNSKRLKEVMKTDVFTYHGYTELYLEGKWVKATPAFNLSLCEAIGVFPLEFDGRNDSLFQQLDQKGNRHMEYLIDHGQYADLPYDEMMEAYKKHYSDLLPQDFFKLKGNFTQEFLSDEGE